MSDFEPRLIAIEESIKHFVTHKSLFLAAGAVIAAIIGGSKWSASLVAAEREIMKQQFEVSLREALVSQNEAFQDQLSKMQSSLEKTISVSSSPKAVWASGSFPYFPQAHQGSPDTIGIIQDPDAVASAMISTWQKMLQDKSVTEIPTMDVYIKANGGFEPLKKK